MSTFSRKLVCIGDGAAGKTCLLIVFANNEFPESYVPTVFENYVATVNRPEGEVELALWDTAGQEDYGHIRPLSYTDANVVLVCYAVDNRDSFDNIEAKWVPELRQYLPKVQFIIVGCKADLRDEGAAATVKLDEAKALAEKVGAAAAFECSAKKNTGITQIFELAADLAIVKQGGGCCTLL
eukprot:m.359971 g.359971  ORF g.359971 m.359971 type:complete len:182 (-) comp18844_c0_seq1:159-704(-)